VRDGEHAGRHFIVAGEDRRGASLSGSMQQLAPGLHARGMRVVTLRDDFLSISRPQFLRPSR
jgi:hypothetical protein